MRFPFAQGYAILAIATASFFPRLTQAQTSPATYNYQVVTTIESVVPGGFGRSTILFTPAMKGVTNGTVKDAPLDGLFSLTGINIDNIRKNDANIQGVMQRLSSEGYELVQTIPLTSSLEKSSIFMTRYIFRKAQ